MRVLVVFWILIVGSSDLLVAQTDWKFEREDEGIMAYTRKREGIKFNEYRVEMIIKATFSQVVAVMKDFESYPDIFPGTEDVKVLRQEEDRHVTYLKFDLPFPAKDRDAVFDNRMTYDQKSDALTIDVRCLTDEYPTNENLIQMSFCEGGWKFNDIGDGKLKIVHNLIVDPGGFAPAWIVNKKSVDDPIKTFKSFRKMVTLPKYRGRSFSLLEASKH